jgi:hypothetical protein
MPLKILALPVPDSWNGQEFVLPPLAQKQKRAKDGAPKPTAQFLSFELVRL